MYALLSRWPAHPNLLWDERLGDKDNAFGGGGLGREGEHDLVSGLSVLRVGDLGEGEAAESGRERLAGQVCALVILKEEGGSVEFIHLLLSEEEDVRGKGEDAGSRVSAGAPEELTLRLRKLSFDAFRRQFLIWEE